MARIERSSTTAPIAPVKTAPEPPVELARPAPAPADDFGSRTGARIASGRYNRYVPTADSSLKAELERQLTGARAGGGQYVKGGSAAPATRAFNPATLARSLQGMTPEARGSALAQLTLPQAQALAKVADPAVMVALLKARMSGEQTTLLEGLSGKQLDALKQEMRAGRVDSPMVQTGISLETLARSKWAKGHQQVVTALREGFAQGNVRADASEGLGQTRDGVLRVSAKLLGSPEGLAAILAHEGTHLTQGADASTPQGEFAGNVAQAQVWAELGNRKDAKLEPEHLAQLNAYSDALTAGGATAVERRVGEKYLQNANEKIAERKAHPDAAWKSGDTQADWEAQASKFKQALDALPKK